MTVSHTCAHPAFRAGSPLRSDGTALQLGSAAQVRLENAAQVQLENAEQVLLGRYPMFKGYRCAPIRGHLPRTHTHLHRTQVPGSAGECRGVPGVQVAETLGLETRHSPDGSGIWYNPTPSATATSASPPGEGITLLE